MDMDDVLPFRVLSPGNKPRLLNKNKFSKLSLKCHSKASEEKKDGNKENQGPFIKSVARSTQAEITDILTSDESELEGSFAMVGGYQCQESSAGSTKFQESTTFLNPIAESTRYEFEQPARYSQQTSEGYSCPQYKTNNGSASHDFTTTACSSEDCDDSVIVISDSDTKSSKKIATSNRARTIMPKSLIILSSDESDSNSKPFSRYILEKTNSYKLTGSKKNVCSTVLVGSSESENDDQGETDMCDVPVVVAPSSIGSIISNSLISEDGSCKLMNNKKLTKNSSLSSIGSLVSNSVISDSEVPLKSCKSPKKAAEHISNPFIKNASDESCKENLQLVLQDSTANESYQKKTTPEWLSKKNQRTPITLTKDKYQDIKRWLLKSRSSDSDEINEGEAANPHQSDMDQNSSHERISGLQKDNPVAGCSINETKKFKPVKCSRQSNSSDGTPKEQKGKVQPRAITPTSDESDDRFESFMKSVKQKRINTLPKQPEPDSSFINDNSSEEDTFSPSLYLTSQTEKKDFRSKKRNNKEDDCRKKILFSPESSDSAPAESGDENCGRNPKKFKSRRRRRRNRFISDSDSSSSDSGKNPRNLKGRKKAVVPKRVESSDSDETKWKPSITSTAPPRMATKLPFKIPVPVTSFTPQAKLKGKASLVPYSPIRTFLTSLSGPPVDPSIRSHPAAEVYFKNFKKKREELTQRLFKLYNREVFDSRLPQDLTLEWNARMSRTAGFCYCRITKKAGMTTRSARIVLSAKVVDSAQRLRDTLIHEMCHAAVWLLNNISGGHGPFWKAWADKAMKRFPELPAIKRCHDYKIETKFTYRCTDCGYSFGRHSKSLDLERKRCGLCYGKFEVFLTKCLSQDSKENAPPKTPRPPTAFALFVKENYATVKKENTHLKHGDVMKKLGENFSKIKLKSAS